MSQKKTALVLGATGLVGTALLKQLYASETYSKIKVITRRPISDPANFPKIDVIELADFSQMQTVSDQLSADDVFCTLGTTIKKAGSQPAFYTVDFTYPLALAQIARENGATHFLIVTATGANPQSKIFYNRVKGELEQALMQIKFPNLTILRPSLLLGERQEFRLGERLAQMLGKMLAGLMPARMKPVSAETVARAMMALADEVQAGTRIVESEQIRELGRG
ncbi:MAG: oxidoreductase [Candidatus Marinimicrobia bacterium CG_4_10_14_0_2_um_filter_48_9]|nr:MAG: oxidoreductase [Candidatus Marinimicrobia bacterium CG_4_10_14_0_2_um_filter_48_9]